MLVLWGTTNLESLVCDWSNGWHVTSELKLHPSMKDTTIQSWPLPSTVLGCFEN
jgi:hypothetical protein